jgi:cytochrome P450
LVAIFGDDYNMVAPHFNLLAEETARNLEFARSFSRLTKIILEVIAQRRRDNSAAATNIRESGQPMPDAQLAKEVMTPVVAGHDTTAGLLNWLWYLLSQHPESRIKLSAELDGLPWPDVPSLDSLSKYA